jgi:hypothetical protein
MLHSTLEPILIGLITLLWLLKLVL